MKKGLGDTVDKITTATGIKTIVKRVTNGNCGCEDRRKMEQNVWPNPNVLNILKNE